MMKMINLDKNQNLFWKNKFGMVEGLERLYNLLKLLLYRQQIEGLLKIGVRIFS